MLRPVDGLVQLPHGGSRHFLGQVEQPKGDGVSPGDLAFLDGGKMFGPMDPGQRIPRLFFPQLIQELAESSHHPAKIPFDPGKSALQPLLVGKTGLAQLRPMPALFAVRRHPSPRC